MRTQTVVSTNRDNFYSFVVRCWENMNPYVTSKFRFGSLALVGDQSERCLNLNSILECSPMRWLDVSSNYHKFLFDTYRLLKYMVNLAHVKWLNVIVQIRTNIEDICTYGTSWLKRIKEIPKCNKPLRMLINLY